jgi:3-oxoadipate enol-lactonase
MSIQHITTGDGCRLAYRFDGPTNAPVWLLSNSLGTDHNLWLPQLADIVRTFRVLRYDTRGHGASDVPVGGYSMDRLGRDVLELLDALGIERVLFCGLSMGGMIGQWLGVRAPERLLGLVLANTSAFMGPPLGWDTRILAVLNKGMPVIIEPVLERWFTSSFRAHAPDAIAPVRAMLLDCDPVGYVG